MNFFLLFLAGFLYSLIAGSIIDIVKHKYFDWRDYIMWFGLWWLFLIVGIIVKKKNEIPSR